MTDITTRLWDRVTSLIKIGRVTRVDESKSVQKLQIQYNDMETRDDISALQFYGFSGSPPVGTNVVVINQSGHAGASIALGTVHPSSRPTNLGSGESKVYDVGGQYIHLSGGNKIIILANSEVDITCSTECKITAPTVTVNASTATTVTSPIINLVGEVRVQGELKKNGVVVLAP